MIRFLIDRPTSVLVTYFGLLLLSLNSLSRLPVSLLPDIPIPEITVLVNYPQHSAQEIEEQVISILRQRLLQVDKLEKLDARASNGSGMISIRFKHGTDIDYSFLEVNEKIDQSLSLLPDDLDRPLVIKATSNDLPAFHLSVRYKDEATSPNNFIELSKFASQVVKRRLEQLESIALVDISGLARQAVRVVPNEDMLISLGINQVDLQDALQNANFNLGSITIQERDYLYNLKLGKPFSSIEDVKAVVLFIEGRVLELGEIAEVSYVEQEYTGLYFSKGNQAINLGIIKNQATQMSELRISTAEVLEDLRREYPEIEFHKSNDQTYLLKYSIQNLQQSLLIGALLAIFIVFLFYANWQTPTIIGFIIPISLLLTLLFFDFFGLSINLISLSGLILGLGLIIDNGIIVLDNIVQAHNASNEITLKQACIEGTNEMIRPLLSSILTTCSVFFPLIFLSGISGTLFFDQAMAVSIGLIISYLVSITLLPTLYCLIKQRQLQVVSKPPLIQRLYKAGYHLCMEHPIWVILVSSTLLVFALYSANQLKLEKLPILDKTSFECYIDWNTSTAPKELMTRTQRILAKKAEDITYHHVFVGPQQFLINNDPLHKTGVSHIFIELKSANLQEDIQSFLNSSVKAIAPNAKIRFQATKTVFEQLFPSTDYPLMAGIFRTGTGLSDNLLQLEKEVSQKLNAAGLTLEKMPTEDQIVILADQEALLHYKVSIDQLYNTLKRHISELELLELKTIGSTTPLVISAQQNQTIEEIVQKLHIQNEEDQSIPIRSLVKTQYKQDAKEILSNQEGPYLPILLPKENAVKRTIEVLFALDKANSNYKILTWGPYFENQQLLKELLKVLLASVLLLYFIMAAQFESLIQPLIVLVEIPISLSGSVLLLSLTNSSLNMMAMIGMVVTVGIIINDSIIKIDTINRLRKQGLDTKQAIYKAGSKRLNPILMTSFTTIFAVLPSFLFQDVGAILQQPLALTLIGGMLIGTMVSLYLIPLLYSFGYRKN